MSSIMPQMEPHRDRLLSLLLVTVQSITSPLLDFVSLSTDTDTLGRHFYLSLTRAKKKKLTKADKIVKLCAGAGATSRITHGHTTRVIEKLSKVVDPAHAAHEGGASPVDSHLSR